MAIAPTPSSGPSSAVPGANRMLALLLVINLFNYIDRQVLSAVLPLLQLDASLFFTDRPLAQFKLGLLTSAFLVTYTIAVADLRLVRRPRRRRWLHRRHRRQPLEPRQRRLRSGRQAIVMLLRTRCLVGIGEAAYGPVAPSMISDLYSAQASRQR